MLLFNIKNYFIKKKKKKAGYIIINDELLNCENNLKGTLTNSECTKQNEEGFFLEGKSKRLINCIDNKCYPNTSKNGYFTNSQNTIIRCSSGFCDYFSNPSINCIGHNLEMISLSNEQVVFCYNNLEQMLSDEYQYFKINNFNAKSTYPNINSGSDTIFLKANKYSIKQYTTNSLGKQYF